jgi:hypothetical protein
VNERKKDGGLIFYIHTSNYANSKLDTSKNEAKRLEGYVIMELISNHPTIRQI